MYRKKCKKTVIAWLCILTMLVGCFTGIGSVASESRAADSEFTEYTFRDFGIADQTVTGASPEFATGLTSWDKVAISGKVTMPGTNADDHYIRFGSWGGFEIRSAGNALILTGGGGGFGSTVANSDGNTNGWVYIPADGDIVDASGNQREVPIRITMEYVNGTNLKVSLTVDEKNTGWIIFTNQTCIHNDVPEAKKFHILLHAASSKTIGVISNEEPEPEYTEYTFRDFGIEDQAVTGRTLESATGLTSWDKVAISGKVTMPGTGAENEHYIRIGSWEGFEIRSASNALILTAGGGGFGSTVANSAGNTNGWIIIPTDGDIVDASGNQREVPIRITMEHVNETNLKVGLTVDGKNTGWITFTNQSSGSSNHPFDLLVHTVAGKTITIASTEKEAAVCDVTCNIEEQPYLLTGNCTVTKDGAAVAVNATEPVLNQAGDYVVTTDQNGIKTTRNVSLYILGDVNLDSSTITDGSADVTLTDADVIALREILAGEIEATAAQKKAADLTNDGKLDNTDLKLLQDIVLGKQTREAVLDRYYPAAVRYEYLETDGSAVMPVAGYERPRTELATQELFDEIKASGINILMSYPYDYQDSRLAEEKVLELAQGAGLGYLVKDSNLNHVALNADDNSLVDSVSTVDTVTMAKKIGNYSYFDSYLGNFVMDEPTLVNAEGKYFSPSNSNDVRNFDHYRQITGQLNSYANTSGYINLPAGVWFKKSFGSGEGTGESWRYNLTAENIAWYEQVVKEITEGGKAKILSFDRYLGGTGESAADCPRYFLNLDIIREQAKASDIPFWEYAPVGEWTESGGSTSSNSKEDMYWSVNTSLAFGAKGIQYFTLAEPIGYKDDGLTMGLYDYNGNKTAWYDYVAHMNQLIAAVDDILMRSENKGIIATGGNAQKNAANVTYYENFTSTGTREIKASAAYRNSDNTPNYAAIKSADGVSRVAGITTTNATAGAFAGVFDHQGKAALYVVNNDTSSAQDITVNFTAASSYRVIGFNASGDVEEVSSLGSSCTRNVGAGEAFLLVIDEEDLAATTQYFEDISGYRSGESFTAPELDGYVFAGWFDSEEAAAKDYTYDTTQSVTASEEEKAGAVKQYRELTFADFGYSTNIYNGWGLAAPITSWDNVAVNGTIIVPADTSKYVRIGTGGSSDWDAAGMEIRYESAGSIAMINEGFGDTVLNSDGNTNGWVSIPKASFGMESEETIAGKKLPIRVLFEPVDDGANIKVSITVNGMATKWIKVKATEKKNCKIFVNGSEGTALSSGGVQISSECPAQPAYARFVDESVLSVKAQLSTDTTVESEKARLRLVTSTNSLIYQNIGFKVQTAQNTDGAERASKTVYRRIQASQGGISFNYEPTVFHAGSQYFATVTLSVSNASSRLDEKITVTPFWTTCDGTKVYGVPRTLTIRQGIDAITQP